MNQIQAILDKGVESRLYTAAVARIVHSQKVVFETAVGLLDPEKKGSEAKSDSMFDLASLTKVFVATVFMKMVESGQIGLDDPVSTVVPEFKCGEKKKVSFRQLLTHSSGLPASFNLYEGREWNKRRTVVVNKLFSTPLIYSPGSKVVYSCLGFMLLGYAMEEITGSRLDKILDDVLFKPLQWQDVLFKPPIKHKDRIAVTTYARPNRGALTPGVVHDGNAIALHGGIAGNAGLFGTAQGVAFLGEMFLNETFLSPQIIEQMISPQAEFNGERRGLGWKLHSKDNSCSGNPLSNSSFGHTGFTGTSLWIDPQAQLTMTLLTNSVHFYRESYDSEEFNDFRRKFHQHALDFIS